MEQTAHEILGAPVATRVGVAEPPPPDGERLDAVKPRRRLVALRVVAMLGIAASGVLVAEALHLDRAWCPLAKACDAARESALGSILGIPTSWIGVVAFAGLLALTFRRGARARRAVRLAGVAAAVAGVVLLAYQAFALGAFCPFCLVADLSGVAAGAIVVFRGAVPTSREPRKRRIAWAVAAFLAVAVPMAWPRGPGLRSWVALGGAGGAPTEAGIPLVEYLNPFCVHCRATHARLAAVLPSLDVAVDRLRLYVWTTAEPPLWAKACACAQEQERERELFRELLRARDEGPGEVYGAAQRAGLDVRALEACVARGGWRERLTRVHDRVRAANLEGLPTLDIGGRRLQGEQTEEELRVALAAAVADFRSPSRR